MTDGWTDRQTDRQMSITIACVTASQSHAKNPRKHAHLTLREKSNATTKPWFSRLLWHPARKWSILGHIRMLTYLFALNQCGAVTTGKEVNGLTCWWSVKILSTQLIDRKQLCMCNKCCMETHLWQLENFWELHAITKPAQDSTASTSGTNETLYVTS